MQLVEPCVCGAMCALAASLFALAGGAAAESKSESEDLFMQMHRVPAHARRLNCHPKGDAPKQGDEARLHLPRMTRGPRDHGPTGMLCDTCHQRANFAASGSPAHRNRHLAPRSMAWEDKTPGEICRQSSTGADKLPDDRVGFGLHQESDHRRYGTDLWTDVNGRGSFVQTLMAVDAMIEDNGPLMVVPGSGRQGHQYLKQNPSPLDALFDGAGAARLDGARLGASARPLHGSGKQAQSF